MSDDETAERPVREQLKKASIDATTAILPKDLLVESSGSSESDTAPTATAKNPSSQDANPKTRDATITGSAMSNKTHGRKRSRDSAIEDSIPSNDPEVTSTHLPTDPASRAKSHDHTSAIPILKDAPTDDAVVEHSLKSPASPCSKRKRLGKEDGLRSDETLSETSTKTVQETRDAADQPITSTSRSAPVPTGLNATTHPQTSSSAFAASGFGALSSAASGFGALAGSSDPASGKPLSSFASSSATIPSDSDSLSGFATGALKSGFASLAPAGGSAFGTTSAFGTGAAPSGFGTLGTAKLTSFASPSGGDLGPAKKVPTTTAFGAPAKDGDDDVADQEGDDIDANGSQDQLPQAGEEKPDERFFERNRKTVLMFHGARTNLNAVETGEEGEETLFTSRAKLYNFVMSDEVGKKEWKERGLGTVRLNLTAPTKGDGVVKPKARLVMRADGSHRVILNTPIKKEIKFGDVKGLAPDNGFIYFMGSVDGGKLELLQLKVRRTTRFATWCCKADMRADAPAERFRDVR